MQDRFSAEIYTLKKKSWIIHILYLILPTDPNMVAHSCRHATHHTVPDLCDTVSLHTILGFKHVTTESIFLSQRRVILTSCTCFQVQVKRPLSASHLPCCWTPHFLNLKTVTNTLTAVFLCTVRFLILSAKLWRLDSVSSFVSQLKKSRFAIIYIEGARRCWFCIRARHLSQSGSAASSLLVKVPYICC